MNSMSRARLVWQIIKREQILLSSQRHAYSGFRKGVTEISLAPPLGFERARLLAAPQRTLVFAALAAEGRLGVAAKSVGTGLRPVQHGTKPRAHTAQPGE